MPNCSCTNLMKMLALVLGLGLSVNTPLVADEFLLRTGGKIRGRWLNRGDHPPQVYLIQTEQGGHLKLSPRLVVKTVYQPASQAEYISRSPTYRDTVADQWTLAEWCRARGLRKQRQAHLQRVIQLDPHHVLARRALGYAQLQGRWVRQHEVLAEQGYVLFGGRWRLPQQVDLLKETQRVKQAERRWFRDTQRWRRQLSSDLATRALAKFRTVDDPHAIAALTRLLAEETDREIRLIYIAALGRIHDDRATSLLVDLALQEQDEEVFHACVDQLVARKSPPLIKVFAETLRDSNNQRVNRAGYVLGRLQDRLAIEPLIDALITTHLFALPDPSGRAPGATTAGFIRRDGADLGNYFAVRSSPQLQEIRRPNQGVLAGLEELAGVSFGYDQRAWRSWYTLHRRTRDIPSLSRKGT